MNWPFSSTLVLICAAAFSTSAPCARQSKSVRLQELVSELKNASTSDESAARLEKLVKANPSLRGPLARQLRPVIAGGPRTGRAWTNALMLAGKLKMGGLAPEIAAYVSHTGTYLIGALSQQYPAGAALKEIGDPAVPALMHVAEKGDPAQRDMAPMIISWIGTPAARRALRVLLRREVSPGRRNKIEGLIRAMQGKP